jgi:hypothetical protein
LAATDTGNTGLLYNGVDGSAGDEVIMSIAGHASRAMLSHYSHVPMEAKRRAHDEIAALQRAADHKRKEEASRGQESLLTSQSNLIDVRVVRLPPDFGPRGLSIPAVTFGPQTLIECSP